MRTPLPTVILLAALTAGTSAVQANDPHPFLVISQRSPTLTAEYWNPILRYVSERSGVAVALKVTRTGQEHSAMVARGDGDFIYSNHQLTPGNDGAGYRVIARTAGKPINGQIVVLNDAPAKTLADLRDKDVVFPSKAAFVGYHVPMDALMRADVAVNSIFAGNQEGAMAQLKIGRVLAAAVNSEVMRDFAQREGFSYRVLWSSESFQGIPVAAHPRVAKDRAERVAQALIGMSKDAEGLKVLEAVAKPIKQQPPYGFVPASDADYENVKRFHKQSLVGNKG